LKKKNLGLKVIGAIFIIFGLLQLIFGKILLNITDSKGISNGIIDIVLGLSFFLPEPEKISKWMYIRIIAGLIVAFILGYNWK
jgi:hypothetical protein